MKKKLIIAFFLLCMIISNNTFAFETSLLDFPSDIYSSVFKNDYYIKEKFFNASSTIRVINKNLLWSFGFGSLSEALQKFSNKNSSANFSNDVLIMLNGKPFWHNELDQETKALKNISLTNIERIEILESPVAIYYGPFAYSRIINIVVDNQKLSLGSYSLLSSENAFSNMSLFNSSPDTKEAVHFSDKKDNITLLFLIIIPILIAHAF